MDYMRKLPKLTDSAKRQELRQEACLGYINGIKGMPASLAKQLVSPSEITGKPSTTVKGGWDWPVVDLDGKLMLVPHNAEKTPPGMCAILPKHVRFCTSLRDFTRFLRILTNYI